MAKSLAVAIGVRKSGNLVELPGAVAGAKEFAAWAEDPDGGGFDKVLLFTDETEPVDGHKLFNDIKAEVEYRGVGKLFVFFAGHGVSLGLDVDYWLLSPGPDDTTDGAVNVANSKRLARRLGIPHVAIFADHCRTAADKPRQGVHGRDIFPNLQKVPKSFELDEFYAALPGDASQEVNDQAAEKSFGIFTRVLMRALRGEEDGPAGLETIDGEPRRVVAARHLRDWIVDAVKLESDLTPGAEVQTPDARPGSYPPNVLAVLRTADAARLDIVAGAGVDPTARARLLTAPDLGDPYSVRSEGTLPLQADLTPGTYCRIELVDAPPALRQDDASARAFRLTGSQTVTVDLRPDTFRDAGVASRTRSTIVAEDGEHATAPRDGVFEVRTVDELTGRVTIDYQELSAGDRARGYLPRDTDAEAAFDELAAAEGRGHYETMTGITVIGAELDPDDPLVAAVAPRGHEGVFFENEYWHVRAPTLSGSAVVDVGGGRRAAVAVIVGFDCTVVVDAIGVRHVAYNALDGAAYAVVDGNQDPQGVEAERLREAMAIASVAASRGRFEVSVHQSSEVAGLLRRYKHRNPTLGILAAYAYDRAGRYDEIVEMIGYFAAEGQPVPYDLVMLAGWTEAEMQAAHPQTQVVPAYPMLTQGWAYLDAGTLPDAVAAARGSLAPTLWATVTGAAGRALAEAIERGELP